MNDLCRVVYTKVFFELKMFFLIKLFKVNITYNIKNKSVIIERQLFPIFKTKKL